MQFCEECGAILNLFQFPDREICPDCFFKEQQKKEEQGLKLSKSEPEKNSTEEKQLTAANLPDDITVSYENNKLVVKSSEGWNLWSGDITTPQKLSMIISRSERIYSIRAKRHNK